MTTFCVAFFFRLKREVPCVCVSKLKSAEKSKMKSIVTKLGGQLVETWTQNSTYLTTSALSLTHVVLKLFLFPFF